MIAARYVCRVLTIIACIPGRAHPGIGIDAPRARSGCAHVDSQSAEFIAVRRRHRRPLIGSFRFLPETLTAIAGSLHLIKPWSQWGSVLGLIRFLTKWSQFATDKVFAESLSVWRRRVRVALPLPSKRFCTPNYDFVRFPAEDSRQLTAFWDRAAGALAAMPLETSAIRTVRVT